MFAKFLIYPEQPRKAPCSIGYITILGYESPFNESITGLVPARNEGHLFRLHRLPSNRTATKFSTTVCKDDRERLCSSMPIEPRTRRTSYSCAGERQLRLTGEHRMSISSRLWLGNGNEAITLIPTNPLSVLLHSLGRLTCHRGKKSG